MALLCPSCGTENRSTARFCIECIAPLPTDFAATVVSPGTTRAMAVDGYEGLPSVLAAFVASRPGPASPPASAPGASAAGTKAPVAPTPPPGPERRRGLWVSVAAFAIAMVIGAGGWLIAGAGGWYIYSSTGSGEAGAATASTSPVQGPMGVAVAAVAPPASAPAAAPATVGASATPADEAAPAPVTAVPAVPPEAQQAGPIALATPADAPRAAPVAATPTRAAPRASPPARKSAQAEEAPVVHAAPKVAARSESREAGSAARAPSQVCGDMNFISRARCMVEQCNAPQFSRHGECVAVREQQRLMELKRNPQLMD